MHTLQEYAQYLRNVGRPITLAAFDDDWVPIGPRIREQLKTAGLAAEINGHIGLIGHAYPTVPTREQWLERCAAVLRAKGGLDVPTALDVARSQLENCNDDLSENPEAAAEDEMSNWTAD